MTVSAALERRDRRTSNQGSGGVRKYRRTFLVVTDTKTDGPNAILLAEDLPRRLDPYTLENESDALSLAETITPRQLRRTPFHWEVDVEYTTDIDKDKEEESDDPLLQPDVVTFGFEAHRKIAYGDPNEPIPIVNSANQPFDPPLMIDDSRPTLTVVRNELAFDPIQAIAFQDAINDDPFVGADIEQVKVKGITATKEIQLGNPEVKFWRVTYVFVFARETWKLRPLDTGTRVFQDPPFDFLFKPYIEKGVVTEILLDGEGNKLATGAPPVFLEFDVYKKKTFAELGIDQTLGIAGFQP